MELALHLGMTEARVRRVMTERELHRWATYRARWMLPQRRLEMLLAQVSLVVAKAVGGSKDATLQDFLFDPAPLAPDAVEASSDDGDEAPGLEDIAEFFGGQVIYPTASKD